MFGSEIVTDWKVGSPILFRGTWEGKPFEDKGEILEVTPPTRMRVTHFSPLTGEADVPENYHEVRYDLAPAGDGTRVTDHPGQQRDAGGRRPLDGELEDDARVAQEGRRTLTRGGQPRLNYSHRT